MEEDAGKMIHVGGADGRITGATHSLVDYNRCGTPLIELVTEPDLRTPEEARIFLQKLRQIYLTLAISDCSMEEGSLRCDGNVSLRPRGSTALGTKTELKNMNSFKNLHDGLAYEICRQAEVLEGGGVVLQETRHWEPAPKRTVSMRVKETADDYRLFPEPDLAPYDLTEEFIEGVRARLPELPDAKKRRYIEDFGLPAADAANLAGEPPLSAFFEESVLLRPALAKPIANFLLNDVAASLNAGAVVLAGEGAVGQVDETGGVVWSGATRDVEDALPRDSCAASRQLRPTTVHWTVVPYGCGETIAEGQHNRIRRQRCPRHPVAAPSPCPGTLTPAGITELVQLMADDTISSKQAKEVFALMTQTGETPGSIVEQRGMRQVSDAGAIEAAVEQVLASNPAQVDEYRGGKTGLLGFFVGQTMKVTGGQGNPRLINEILRKHLDG
jgi:aspartyl-tRNA(Asn)/glutamyl-tRNA(Gln) amidotransferase subunit B